MRIELLYSRSTRRRKSTIRLERKNRCNEMFIKKKKNVIKLNLDKPELSREIIYFIPALNNDNIIHYNL